MQIKANPCSLMKVGIHLTEMTMPLIIKNNAPSLLKEKIYEDKDAQKNQKHHLMQMDFLQLRLKLI